MSHSTFSPSSAHRWIACPGSMAFPENHEDGGSSKFADDGTASHHWAALCLQQGRDAEFFIGAQLEYGTGIYEMDETRASFVQMYLDDVRRRAMGGSLFIEHRVDLSHILGEDQGGTADALIYLPASKTLICEDLKYGTGEKVNAERNPQLALYLLGALGDMELLGYDVENFIGVVCQPRLGHVDEYAWDRSQIMSFADQARAATVQNHLNPGEKQCRWCRAKSRCPALAKFVADEVRADFDTIASDPAPASPKDHKQLAKAYLAVPLIEDWCNAVRADLAAHVTNGEKIAGPDGLPYKFVEGKPGYRAWADATVAEAALLGQLPPEKAYAPQKIITAPQAAKILDKKATKALWKDIFEPMIKQPPGKPVLATGSDPRPPFAGSATADEFEEDLAS